MFKPLKEQQDVLDFSGDIVVCASAGCGKTSVMIRKIISIVMNDKISLQNFLVLTFTNAAANEMKERLSQGLLDDGSDFALQMLDELPLCDISTIHSFCDKLIKKYGFYLNINRNFTLLSEGAYDVLKKNAFKLALEKFTEKYQDEAVVLLENYKNSNDAIENIVFGIHNYLSARLNKEIKQSDFILANKILNNDLLKHKGYIESRFNDFCKVSKSEKYVKYVNTAISNLSTLSENFDFVQNLNNLLNFELDRFAEDKLASETETNMILEIKESLAKFMLYWKQKNLGDEKIIKMSETANLSASFIKLEEMFEVQYKSLKTKYDALDFNDLERYAIELLGYDEVLKEVKELYKFIFVDEYQDINSVQEFLIKTISENNLFRVGDPKQGIYGFREASPEIMLSDMKRGEITKILKSNFRSDEQILNFVNEIFKIVMKKETCGIDYLNTSMLSSLASYPKTEDLLVEVIQIKKEKLVKPIAKNSYDVLDETEREDSSFKNEAVCVARKIIELLDTEIFDKEQNLMRRVRLGDITILVRSRGEFLDALTDVLTTLKIPVVSDSRKSLLKNELCQGVLAFLKCARCFHDDISLAAALLSPFGGLNEEDLAKIKLSNLKESFYKNVEIMKCADGDIEKKVSQFFSYLEIFKISALANGIYYSLSKIMSACSFFDVLAKYQDAEKKLFELNLFLSEIKNSGNDYDLIALLEFFEKSNQKSLVADSSSQDFVNISTIHASKGLEYPIVFLCGAGQGLIKNVDMSEFKINERLGLSLKFYDNDNDLKYNTLTYEATKIVNRENIFMEELRLLYVALTRAKCRLIVTGASQELGREKFKSDFDIIRAGSYLEIILGCFDDTNKNTLKLSMFEESELFQSFDEVKYVEPLSDDKIMEDFFNFQYPFKEEINELSKTSVTRLINNESLFSSEAKVEDGNLYHKIFAEIDFKSVKEEADVIEFLNDKKEYDSVDRKVVFENIKVLNSLIKGNKAFKEKKFIMKEKNTLVQGVIDLISIEERVLVDYKYTNLKNSQKIIDKYTDQIKLYEKAACLAFGGAEYQKYILSIKENKLIKIN